MKGLLQADHPGIVVDIYQGLADGYETPGMFQLHLPRAAVHATN